MHKKFIIAVLVIVVALGALITSATKSSAKPVVTVAELVSNAGQQENIRLGARLTEDEIDYQVEPELKLQFRVHDITSNDAQYGENAVADSSAAALVSIPVLFEGIMPDTLKPGRDVILEGNFDGRSFHANSLLTQCPSKYEPPVAPVS